MRRFHLQILVAWLLSWSSTFGEEDDHQQLLADAQRAAAVGDSQQAVDLVTTYLSKFDQDSAAFYLRGRERFRLGDPTGSLADFDHMLELDPRRRPQLWERGISCYYAKQYQAGADQFSAYQTYDDNDVENAVWHFLCLAKEKGLDQARESLMRVRRDRRVPMMEIYQLYADAATVNDVIKAAQAVDGPANRNRSLFYAHLYIGLLYDVRNESKQARQHIVTAADKHRIGHYMWDVARVHAARWRSP